MGAANFAQALEKFEAAGRADPGDPEPAFWQGAALNRLGRAAEALARLQRATAAGSRHPDLAFESGWSLLSLGRWRDAVEALERYERARPGRGKTSEFLGRAYLGLGEHDRAEAALQEALKRDARLAPTVPYYMALVAQARGDIGRARDELMALLRDHPESPLARAARERLDRLVGARPEKPWRVSLSSSGGFNDNAITLGEAALVPADISAKSSWFSRHAASGSYDLRFGADDVLTAAYRFRADVYDRISNVNSIDHLAAVSWRHRFAPGLVASLRAADQYTLVDHDRLRNQASLRPALAYRLAEWAAVELSYGLFAATFFNDVPPEQDRDGIGHAFSLDGFLDVPGTKLRMQIGVFRVTNNANGGDFDFDSTGVRVGLSHPILWGVTGEVFYTRSFDDYRKKNSLAGNGGFQFAREDEVDAVSVQLARPIFDWLRAFVRFDYTRNDSNIGLLQYEQIVGSAGLALEY